MDAVKVLHKGVKHMLVSGFLIGTRGEWHLRNNRLLMALGWSNYGGLQLFLAGQMPPHLISDAHEWIKKIPTVPTYYLAKQ